MTRTRASCANPRGMRLRSLRSGTTRRKQTKNRSRNVKMKAQIPKTTAKFLQETTEKTPPNHCRQGNDDLPDYQEATSTVRLDETNDDVESSGDEELPAVAILSPATKTKVKELIPGTVVWAKSRGWPHWPAVLVKVFRNETKAWVNYLDERNQRVQVSLRTIAPFSGPSTSKFIELGKASKFSRDFKVSLERAEDYLIKRGLGKTASCSCNVSFTSSAMKSDNASTLSTSRMSQSHETSHDASGDTEPSATLPTSTSISLLSDEELRVGHPLIPSGQEELRVGHPLIPSSQNGDGKEEDDDLAERRRAWKNIEARLLKYIRRDITKNHLLSIYHGKTKSERQRLFESSRARDKQRLRSMVGLGPITDDESQSDLTCFLRDLYVEHCMECKEDIPDLSYITEVWIPEAIIFAIHKTRRVGKSNAEKLFHKEGVQSLVDLGEDMPCVVPSAEGEILDEW